MTDLEETMDTGNDEDSDGRAKAAADEYSGGTGGGSKGGR